MLVVKDRGSKALSAHVVPQKGATVEWIVEQLKRDLAKWGIWDTVQLVIRCDGEFSLNDLMAELGKARTEGRTIIENSPKGESASNGMIEAAVKGLEGQVRTLWIALQKRIQANLEVTHPIFAWVIKHSADLITRLAEGSDGQTAWQRLRGRPFRGEMLEIGCQILHRVPGKVQGGLLQDRWLSGTYLGKRWASEEHIISMEDGKVVRARAVQEEPEERRWVREKVEGIVGVPWASMSTLNFKGDRGTLPPKMQQPAEPTEEPAPCLPRNMSVQPRHFEKYGHTEGCTKCRQVREGHYDQHSRHTPECRARIIKRATEDPAEEEVRRRVEERNTRYLERFEEHDNNSKRQKVEEPPPPASKPDEEHPPSAPEEPAPRRRRRAKAGTPIQQNEEGTGAQSSSPAEARDDGPVGIEEEVVDRDIPMTENVMAEGPMPDANGQMPDDSRQVARPRETPAEDNETAEPEPQRRRLLQTQEILQMVSDEEKRRRLISEWEADRKKAQRNGESKHKYLICEAFSPPRVSARARSQGKAGGWSLDFREVDPITGRRWNLAAARDLRLAKTRIREDRPAVLIVCPPCTLFSALQSFSGGPDPVELSYAIHLVKNALELCTLQAKLGGTFVFEHPMGSKAWKLPCMQEFIQKTKGLVKQTFHMCGHGMTSMDQHGEGLVYKATTILTNNAVVADKVATKCSGDHRHVPLLDGRAKAASTYPPELCDRLIEAAEVIDLADKENACDLLCRLHESPMSEWTDPGDNTDIMMDDSGKVKKPVDYPKYLALRQRAMGKEIQTMADMTVYEYVPYEAYSNDPEGILVGTTWV